MVIDLVMTDMADVKKINDFACKCDFNVYVSTNTGMIDAKSMLGLTTLVGRKDLRLCFPDHIKFSRVETAMKKAKLL